MIGQFSNFQSESYVVYGGSCVVGTVSCVRESMIMNPPSHRAMSATWFRQRNISKPPNALWTTPLQKPNRLKRVALNSKNLKHIHYSNDSNFFGKANNLKLVLHRNLINSSRLSYNDEALTLYCS